MFSKLSEEDFAVLKEPLESGRQSPSSLGVAMVLFAILQSFVYFLIYDVTTRGSKYPNIDTIKNTHFWVTGILVVLSIIYAIPIIYKRSQKNQYLLSILVSQNVGAISIYLGALFLIGQGKGVTEEYLLNITYFTLVSGVLVFLATFIRFYILLRKGAYRKGSKRDEIRGNLEQMIKSNMTTIIIASVGLGYIVQSLFRSSYLYDSETIFMIILGMGIFYAMLFVLPEQLVILYCKFRFKSFNFDEDGDLWR